MTQPADTLLVNGRILTMDSADAVQQAVAIRGARLQAVGSDARPACPGRPATHIIDLQGHTVVPGLIDTHAHMDREGLKNLLPGLEGVHSIADILAVIKREVAGKRPGEWVVTMPIGNRPNYADVLTQLAEGAIQRAGNWIGWRPTIRCTSAASGRPGISRQHVGGQ